MSIAFLDPGKLEGGLQSGAIAGYSLLWLLFCAIIPTLIVALAFDRSEDSLHILNEWLNILQSIQIPFALIPLLCLVSNKEVMGVFTIGPVLKVCALCFEVKRFPNPYNKVMELGAVKTETSMFEMQLCPQDKSDYGGYSSLSTMTGASKLCSEDKLLEVQTLEDWREIQSAVLALYTLGLELRGGMPGLFLAIGRSLEVQTLEDWREIQSAGANPFSSISFKSAFASSSLPLEQNPLISTLNVATFGCFPSLSILRLTVAAALGFPSWQ
nr:metal transporter Nramp3 [Ipomoea batatas]